MGIAAIGEVMVELAPYRSVMEGAREVKVLSYAGDTFNTAVYLARLGVPTDYVTLLGDDSQSDHMLKVMADESIGTAAIKRIPGACPGLYMISNTSDGEREFTYWRKDAPARQLFGSDHAAAVLAEQLAECSAVYVSGITLAIIPATARRRLIDFLKNFRAGGGAVAFDSNYRPRLWQSTAEAQQAVMAVMAHTDIALLTLDDEQLLWGDGSIESCRERYRAFTLPELVLKRGAREVVVITPEHQQSIPVPPVKGVVDTTGAGDSFNAGYLAARLQGATPAHAASAGIRCAAIVIRHAGGVIDRSTFLREYNP